MSFTNTFEEELVGLDKTNTVNAYYARDLSMNLNNSNIIITHLKKLGYYNINFNVEEETYIKAKIIRWIKTSSYSDLLNTNLNNLISEIRASAEFAQFTNRFNLRLERSNELSHYINNNDTYDFYSKLTLEELNSLGY